MVDKEIEKKIVTLFEKEVLSPLGNTDIFIIEALELLSPQEVIDVLSSNWSKWNNYFKENQTFKRAQEIIHLLKEKK